MHREHFGATEAELETIIAYQEAMKKIKKGASAATAEDDGAGDGEVDPKMGKPKKR